MFGLHQPRFEHFRLTKTQLSMKYFKAYLINIRIHFTVAVNKVTETANKYYQTKISNQAAVIQFTNPKIKFPLRFKHCLAKKSKIIINFAKSENFESRWLRSSL